jgi:hypothetical protein
MCHQKTSVNIEPTIEDFSWWRIFDQLKNHYQKGGNLRLSLFLNKDQGRLIRLNLMELLVLGLSLVLFSELFLP